MKSRDLVFLVFAVFAVYAYNRALILVTRPSVSCDGWPQGSVISTPDGKLWMCTASKEWNVK